MESKKKPNSDLNPLRSLFLAIGILVSISIISAAFEYKTSAPLFSNPNLHYDDDEFWCTFTIFSEPDTIPDEDSEHIFIAETEPQFPGGKKAWTQFLQNHLRPIAVDSLSTNKVYLSFIIDQKGKLTDAKVMRSLSPKHDEEALRVLALSPDWVPATQRKVPVKYRMSIWIRFPKNLKVKD